MNLQSLKNIFQKYWNQEPLTALNYLSNYSYVGMLLYPSWYLVFKAINPEYKDYLWERFIVISLLMGLALLKKTSEISIKSQLRVFAFTIFAIIIHSHILIWRNNFDLYYLIGTIVGSSSIVIILSSVKIFLGVSIISILLALVIFFHSPSPTTLFLLFSHISIITCGAASLFYRLSMHSQIEEHQNKILEQLNIIEKNQIEIDTQRAQSAQANKMAAIGEMASGIAHEINNPLAIIRGAAESIEIKLNNESIEAEYLEKNIHRIINVSDRIKKIISGLKTFSYGNEGLPFEKTTMQSVLNSTLELCQEKFKFKKIDFKTHLNDQITAFDAQTIQLTQVFLNLINNSIDAIENKSEKWIEMRSSLIHYKNIPYLEIHFRDSGDGISNELAQKIFEPFFTTKL